MGFFDDLLSGITGGISGIVGGFTNLITGNQVNKTNKGIANEQLWASQREAERNRQFQSDEAAINRRFSSNEAALQRQWSTRERINQFQLSNEEYDRRLADERSYNSPLEQAKRLKEAGINPAVLGSSNASSDSSFAPPTASLDSGAAASPPSTPSGAMAQLPNAPYLTNNNYANMAQSIGSFIESLSKSGLNDAQKERITSLLGNEVELQLLERQGKELVNKGLEIANFIQDSTKDKQVQQAFQNLMKTKAEITLLGAQSGKVDEERLHEVEKRFLTIAQRKLTGEQYNMVLKQLEWYDTLQESFLKVQSATVQELGSRTAVNSSQASYLDQLTTLGQLDEQVRRDPNVVNARKQLIINTANKVKSEGNLTDEQISKISKEVDILTKTNDWYEIEHGINVIRNIISGGKDVVTSAKGIKSLKGKPKGKGKGKPSKELSVTGSTIYW